ncbi:hypothetical protein [Streptomyces sp. Ac-502]|uniref:hypothetical protein n=1 Tax=Streptomyces sp. Ac-502 TaxID=3342801 RepID=UPI003862B1C1
MDVEQLKKSSKKWMSAALRAFSQGPKSYDFAVHHAGIAAEHLLKAYLASLHPALIVEAKDFDSLLHATGHGRHASVPVSRAKTIGLAEAHDRVRKILGNRIPIDQRALRPVANARNGVAHSGIHDVAEVRTVFTTCLRLVDALLTELKIDPAPYWWSYKPLHDRLIEERVKDARIQLESKLVKARGVFEQRYGHLRPSQSELVLAAITRRPPRYAEHAVERPCPACRSTGWLMGGAHIEETEDEHILVLDAHMFACSACGLDVENEEFWELGDLSSEIVLLDASDWEPDPEFLPDDPDEPTIDADWEPDEDLFRGR